MTRDMFTLSFFRVMWSFFASIFAC